MYTLHTVDTSAIGNETKVLEFIHEILKGVIGGVEQLRLYQTLDDPVRIPVV